MKKIAFAILTILICYSFVTISDNLIRWKFDKFKKLTFKWEQVESTKSVLPIGNGDSTMKMFNRLEGKLIVKVKNKKFADIILEDLKMSVYEVSSSGDTLMRMSQTVTEMFMQDLKEDGTIEGQLSPRWEMLAKIMFPIMNKDVKIGDTVDLPMTIPFDLLGSRINVKGNNRIKYLGNEEGLDKLETIINVSDYTIPDEVKIKYKCYMKGSSKFDFDSKKGYFTSGVVNFNMAFGTASSDSSKSMMNMTNMSMDMNTKIALKLIAVE